MHQAHFHVAHHTDNKADDAKHYTCGQLVYDPFEQAGMVAVPSLRLLVQHRLRGTLIEFTYPKLVLGPTSQQLFMNAMLINSNVTTHEAITWCMFNFPIHHPTVEYGNGQLILNLETAHLQVTDPSSYYENL